MIRIWMAALSLLALSAVSAAADDLAIDAGQWKTTSKTVVNGAVTPLAEKLRCLTKEQAGDVAKTFGPVSGTVNSSCEPTVFETSGRTLKWHLQCRGQLDLDVIGVFNFDSSTHYTAVVASKGVMGGQLINDAKTEIEGERVGECGQQPKP
jgi:hypothetical protein